MKYYNTSALLRAWKEEWVPESGLTRSHTVAEWISIQTGRGLVYRAPDGRLIKRNLSPADAAQEAQRLFAWLTFRDLSGRQTLEAAGLAAAKGGFEAATSTISCTPARRRYSPPTVCDPQPSRLCDDDPSAARAPGKAIARSVVSLQCVPVPDLCFPSSGLRNPLPP